MKPQYHRACGALVAYYETPPFKDFLVYTRSGSYEKWDTKLSGNMWCPRCNSPVGSRFGPSVVNVRPHISNRPRGDRKAARLEERTKDAAAKALVFSASKERINDLRALTEDDGETLNENSVIMFFHFLKNYYVRNVPAITCTTWNTIFAQWESKDGHRVHINFLPTYLEDKQEVDVSWKAFDAKGKVTRGGQKIPIGLVKSITPWKCMEALRRRKDV